MQEEIEAEQAMPCLIQKPGRAYPSPETEEINSKIWQMLLINMDCDECANERKVRDFLRGLQP
jgi:hypothetical protein